MSPAAAGRTARVQLSATRGEPGCAHPSSRSGSRRSGCSTSTLAKAVEQKVRAILVAEFGELVTETLASEHAPRRAALIAGVAPEERRALLLKDLPSAAQYHRLSIRAAEIVVGAEKVERSKADLVEGTGIEPAYLTARVERAARLRLSVETRTSIEAQIDRIMGEGAKVVGDRLGAGAAPARTRKAFEDSAITWNASLDSPYDVCLDRPLSGEDLAEVLAGMRADAQKTAADEDVLIPTVRTAACRSLQRCFRDFAAFDKKSLAWGGEVQGEERRLTYLSETTAGASPPTAWR
jgi:hypothetical protein